MQTIPLTKDLIRGAVSLELKQDGIRPWRLPHDQLVLFASELVEKAGETAGVRIAFESESITVELQLAPTALDFQLEMVIDNELLQSKLLPAGSVSCLFDRLPNGRKRLEIYLPQKAAVTAIALKVDDSAIVAALPAGRPRWVTYGSSITQCSAAESPAQTWPAIVARSKGWDLTCLGYGGQCHLEPMVARVIRDLPADIISMCLGINVMGKESLNIRTFRSAVIGMIAIIREKHPTAPMFILSPIYCPHRETEANGVGLTLVKMREEILEAVQALTACGDTNLTYIDGLDIFGEAYADYLPDQLHPNAEGYKIMAKHIGEALDLVKV
jgi:hypothetical protein